MGEKTQIKLILYDAYAQNTADLGKFQIDFQINNQAQVLGTAKDTSLQVDFK